MPTFENIESFVSSFVINSIVSIIIFILFLTLANYTKNLILSFGSKKISDPKSEALLLKRDLIYDQFSNIIYYTTIFIGIVFATINLGIQQTTILTILGSFGLAMGLAMQGLITNFIAGIYITLNDLFKINDVIKLNNITGQVINFTLLNTVVRDTNNNIIHIPNNQLRDNILTNLSK
jgi:small conductance mechanosensitive channel